MHIHSWNIWKEICNKKWCSIQKGKKLSAKTTKKKGGGSMVLKRKHQLLRNVINFCVEINEEELHFLLSEHFLIGQWKSSLSSFSKLESCLAKEKNPPKTCLLLYILLLYTPNCKSNICFLEVYTININLNA